MKTCLTMAVTLLALCVFGVPSRADAESVSPKPSQTATQEPHWQLFLDDHVITRSTGFRRVLHHPQPRGVVIPADKPWETWGISPSYVGRRKDGLLECYYQAHWRAKGGYRTHIAYAVSRDGVHWEKPMLKLVDGPGGKENNFVPCGPPVDLGQYGNVSDPAKRFAILGDGSRPMRVYFSPEVPDFTGDPDWRKRMVLGGTKPSYKLALHFWDDEHEEWVFMRQSPNHPPTRCVARWTTKDLRNWTVQPVLYPDAADSTDPRYFDEIYGMCAIYTEGIVLGFAEWMIGDQTRPDMAVLPQKLIGRVHMKGTMDVRVTVSRDWGYTWDRTVSREAWIPHGTEHDSYDRCVRLLAAPVRVGDEDWFYCPVVNGDHGSGMGYFHDRKPKIQTALYTQKHNRYVSLTAGNTPQFLITEQIKVTGKTLQLNVDASRGEVKVGIGIDKTTGLYSVPGPLVNYMIRDRQGRTHLEEGFHIEDCEPVHVNSIEHNVAWKDAKLESLLGKTVRLYIMVQDADLYGFRFK